MVEVSSHLLERVELDLIHVRNHGGILQQFFCVELVKMRFNAKYSKERNQKIFGNYPGNVICESLPKCLSRKLETPMALTFSLSNKSSRDLQVSVMEAPSKA